MSRTPVLVGLAIFAIAFTAILSALRTTSRDVRAVGDALALNRRGQFDSAAAIAAPFLARPVADGTLIDRCMMLTAYTFADMRRGETAPARRDSARASLAAFERECRGRIADSSWYREAHRMGRVLQGEPYGAVYGGGARADTTRRE